MVQPMLILAAADMFHMQSYKLIEFMQVANANKEDERLC